MKPTREDVPEACVLDTPSSVNSLLYWPAPSVENCEFLLIENDPALASRMSVEFITPGASCTSTIGLLPKDGSSSTRRESMTCPSEDSAVLSRGVSARTSTDSEVLPTCNSIFTSTVSLTRTSILSRTVFLKPAISDSTVYEPV